MIRDDTQLVLNQGEVFFERFAFGESSGRGERYIGNTTQFTVERAIERLERRKSYRGQTYEGKGAVVSMDLTATFVTDNISLSNVEDWLGNGAIARSSGNEFVPAVESFPVYKNRFFQLGKTDSLPLGTLFVDRLSVTRSGVTMEQGLDYDFEAARGRVQILGHSKKISDGDTLRFEYLKRPSSVQIVASVPKEIYGALRYIPDETATGPSTVYYFPMVRLSPQGQIDLKGDQWQQMKFVANAMRLNPAMEMLYAMRPGSAPAAITADTTLITADTNLITADNGEFPL